MCSGADYLIAIKDLHDRIDDLEKTLEKMNPLPTPQIPLTVRQWEKNMEDEQLREEYLKSRLPFQNLSHKQLEEKVKTLEFDINQKIAALEKETKEMEEKIEKVVILVADRFSRLEQASYELHKEVSCLKNFSSMLESRIAGMEDKICDLVDKPDLEEDLDFLEHRVENLCEAFEQPILDFRERLDVCEDCSSKNFAALIEKFAKEHPECVIVDKMPSSMEDLLFPDEKQKNTSVGRIDMEYVVVPGKQ